MTLARAMTEQATNHLSTEDPSVADTCRTPAKPTSSHR